MAHDGVTVNDHHKGAETTLVINMFDDFKLSINFFVCCDGHVIVRLSCMRAHTCKCKGVVTNFADCLDSIFHVVAHSFTRFCALGFKFIYLSRGHYDFTISCVLFVVLHILHILLENLSWCVVYIWRDTPPAEVHFRDLLSVHLNAHHVLLRLALVTTDHVSIIILKFAEAINE